MYQFPKLKPGATIVVDHAYIWDEVDLDHEETYLLIVACWPSSTMTIPTAKRQQNSDPSGSGSVAGATAPEPFSTNGVPSEGAMAAMKSLMMFGKPGAGDALPASLAMPMHMLMACDDWQDVTTMPGLRTWLLYDCGFWWLRGYDN